MCCVIVFVQVPKIVILMFFIATNLSKACGVSANKG